MHLLVRTCASPLSHVRVGIIVPRFGHSAVARNRMKRWLREAIRLELLPRAPSADVMVRAFKSVYHLSFRDVREEVLRACSKLRTG